MKLLFRCFIMFIRQILKDGMLYAVCMAPLLAAVAFRCGIPFAESLLCEYFDKTSILAGYYLLFDIFLAVLTPFLFCFASSMVMLTEYDENMAGYIAVTPVGKRGYIVSRFVFPAGISFLVSIVLLSVFSLTVWTIGREILVCLLAGIMSVAVSLLLVSLSHNRVEGMAVSKMCGILMMGLPVPFFLSSGVQYLFSFLPSFWIARLCIENKAGYAVPAFVVSLFWIAPLYKKFERKFL